MAKVVAIFGDKDHLRYSPKAVRIVESWIGHRDLETTTLSTYRGATCELDTPEKRVISNYLRVLWPFELVLICGDVARQTYHLSDTMRDYQRARVIELPHPLDKRWTKQGLGFAKRLIQDGRSDLYLQFVKGKLQASPLVPF